MSNTPESADDPRLIGTHQWRLVSSGSALDLVPVGSSLTPLAVWIAAVLLAGAIKLAGTATFFALTVAGVVVAVGLMNIWANRLAEARFRRIRFDGLRRCVEIGEEVRSFDSFSSIGVDRVMMSRSDAPRKKVQRAILTLRAGESTQSLPLIQGNLLKEPAMETASRQISELADIPVVHHRSVDPTEIRNQTILIVLFCMPLVAVAIGTVVVLKEQRDRRHLKERAVFAEAAVLSDHPGGRGPFRTLKIQLEDRTAQLTTRRWETFQPGEKVTVFYDPVHPNLIKMDDSRHSLPAQSFLLLGPIAAGAFSAYLLTRAVQGLRIARRT